MPLQIRRGTNVERQAITPAPGELIFVTNTNQLFVGNGVTVGGILATGYTNNDAQDAAAVIFTANNSAHSNINFAYNTSLNLITAAVNLSDYAGVIKADAFKGSVFADDGSTVGGTELVNAVDGSLNLNGTVKDHVIPDASLAYDLGSAALRFRDLYLSGSSIELGAATITATGSAVNLPAGSTVGGVAIGGGSGGGSGGGIDDYSGNIIGDDSTIIVNTSNNTVSGTFIGDIKGSVFGDDSTKIVDAVDNEVYATGGFFGTLNGNVVGNGVATLLLQNSHLIDDAVAVQMLGNGIDAPTFTLSSSLGTLTNPTNHSAGNEILSMQFKGYANGLPKEAAGISTFWSATADMTSLTPDSNILFTTRNNIDGFKIFRFDEKGVFTAPVLKAASYTTINLPVGPEAGWIVFDSTTQKFKGYVSDTGIAGGGAPNTTPGWVNLN